MDDITKGIAFGVDDSMFNVDELLKWYDNLDFTVLNKICERKLEEIQIDMDKFEIAVKNVSTQTIDVQNANLIIERVA